MEEADITPGKYNLELYFLIPRIFLHLCLVTWRFWSENPDSTCIQVSHRSTSHHVGCVCSLALTLAALTPHVPKSHTALHTMWTVSAPWHSPWPWGPEHWAQSEHKGSLRSLRRSRATKVKDKGSSPGLEPGQDRLLIFSVELLLAPEFFLCGIFSLTAVVWDAGVCGRRGRLLKTNRRMVYGLSELMAWVLI